MITRIKNLSDRAKLIVTGIVLSLAIWGVMVWMRTNYATPYAIAALIALLAAVPSRQSDTPVRVITPDEPADLAGTQLPQFDQRAISYGEEEIA